MIVSFSQLSRVPIGDFGVGVGPPVTEERPSFTHLADHVEIEIGDHQLVLVVRALVEDFAAWIDEIARAVKLTIVPWRFPADPVVGADKDAVGNRRGGLLDIPQMIA